MSPHISPYLPISPHISPYRGGLLREPGGGELPLDVLAVEEVAEDELVRVRVRVRRVGVGLGLQP